MAIWIEEDAKVLVQGITGKQGMFHADKMVEYGTNIVGGCTPGKGGQTVDLQGNAYPVWNSMFEAIEATDADATVIYVPPPFAAEAIMEAADAFDQSKEKALLFVLQKAFQLSIWSRLLPLLKTDLASDSSVQIVLESSHLETVVVLKSESCQGISMQKVELGLFLNQVP